VGLWKRYRRSRSRALEDVDLAIETGTVTARVGPNGAGTTTLIRTWIGFERPSRGHVRVAGR
jgi:ABC-type multidrug transport system ATPase subunit